MSKDPHIANIFSAEEEDCLSLEQLTAYQEAKLQGQEKHLVERHLLNCELCAITYESMLEHGAETIASGASEVAEQAWSEVQQLQSIQPVLPSQQEEKRKRRGAIFWIVAAASIALIITVGYFGLQGPSDAKMQFAAEEGMDKTSPLQPDSETKATIAMAESPDPSTNSPTDAAPVPTDAGVMPEETMKAKSEPVKALSNSELGAANPSLNKPKNGNLKFADDAPKDAMKGGNAPVPSPSPKAPVSNDAPTAANHGYAVHTIDERDQAMGGAEKKDPEPRKNRQEDFDNATAGDEMMDGDFAMDDMAGEEISENEETQALSNVVTTEGKIGRRELNVKESRTRTVERAAPASAPSGRLADAPVANYFADGIAAYEQGNYRVAAENLRMATEATPNNFQAHLFAADAYLRISQPKAALFHVERILATPGNSAYEDAEWYKALALLQLKDARKAEKQLDVVIARNGKHKAKAAQTLQTLK